MTEPPAVVLRGGRAEASCATPGASVGWTTTPPRPAAPASPLAAITGDPDDDGRRWQLYAGPFEPPADVTLYFRAWRLGFRPSEETLVTAPSAP